MEKNVCRISSPCNCTKVLFSSLLLFFILLSSLVFSYKALQTQLRSHHHQKVTAVAKQEAACAAKKLQIDTERANFRAHLEKVEASVDICDNIKLMNDFYTLISSDYPHKEENSFHSSEDSIKPFDMKGLLLNEGNIGKVKRKGSPLHFEPNLAKKHKVFMERKSSRARMLLEKYSKTIKKAQDTIDGKDLP